MAPFREQIEIYRIAVYTTKIEYYAFKNCKNLRNIALPEGLEYIGYIGFRSTGIAETAFSGALQKVRESAFAYRASLKAVWVEEDCQLDIS